MAQNRGQAILDSGNTTTGSTCNGASAYFNLNSRAFVVIQGFVIQNACDAGFQSNASEHDITLRWNTVQYIANRTITDQYGRDGIYLNGSEYNFTFDGNVFHDIGRTGGVSQNHFDHGIYAAATGLTIINNVFYNMHSGFSIQIDGGSNWLIANNTFAFPNTGDGEAGDIMFWNPISNVAVENNIFYQPNTSAVTQYATTMSGCTFKNNLIYGVSGIMNGSTAGMSVGTNQVGANPLFVNASAPYNFALNAGSPAIAAGVSLAQVTDDINGAARPSNPAVGAYQSAPAGPVVSNVSVTSITSNSAYVNWTTSDASNSSVQYGTTGLTSSTAVNSSMLTTHSMAVAGLSASTSYQFRVASTDSNGVQGVSPTSNFTTAAPPVIATTFSVAAGSPAVSIVQGGSGSSQVTASLLTGSAAAVSLSVPAVSGLTTSLSMSSCTLTCSSMVTISASTAIAAGTYTLKVTGSGSGMTASANIAVTVTAAAAPAAPTTPPTAGLMADWALTASSGTAAADTSGNGNTGAVNNGYWWTSVHGPCLYLSGQSSYVTVNESSSLEEKSTMTVAFWVDPNANPITDQRLISKSFDWDVKLNGTNRYPQFETSYAYAQLNYPMGVQTWYHVVFTFSNGVVKGYVNGAAVGFLANTFASGGTLPQFGYGLYLGTDPGLTQNFVGSLAGVRIYNQVLSDAQVAALYASGQ
jgi:hypothetical protein